MSVGLAVSKKMKETVAGSVYDNPVVVREFRTRMRGKKAFLIMGAYILLLAVFLFIHYIQVAQSAAFSHGNPASFGNERIGARLFSTLVWTQTILLMFILPALTSGSLTLELEKKTIEMLALTRLSAGRIVIGKHLSGFLYALMLLACSVPLASMCLMFGGLSPAEVAVTYSLLISYSFLFTALGVYWSSLFKNTASASACCYAISIGYMLITNALSAAFMIHSAIGPGGVPHGQTVYPLALLNPAYSGMGMALVNTKVCGLEFPAAIPSFGLQMAVGVLLLLVATTHVRYRSVDRALSIKLLLIALMSAVVWLIIGGLGPIWSTSRPNDWQDMLGVISTLILIFSSVVASMFSSGVLKNGSSSMFLYALSGRRIFKSDIGGAMAYTALFTACVYGALGITLFWMAKSAGAKIDPGFWPAYKGVGIAIVMMATTMAAAGIFASTILKQRNGAAALVILFLIVAFAGYGIMLMYHGNRPQADTSPIWQLAAFWPMTPILGATDEWNSYMPHLWWRPEMSWKVTTCAYAVLTLILLGLASLTRRKSEGVQED